MQLNNLIPKTKNKKTMIVGRGGKRGKTAGRGGKGQTARAGHKKRPELRDFIKRIPKLRGRGVNGLRTIETKPVSVNLKDIELAFKAGDIVLLKKQESAPYDLLLIDSKDEICLINDANSCGTSFLALKRPLSLTKGFFCERNKKTNT